MCILFCLQEDWKFIVVHKQRRTCKTCIWDNHEVSSQSSRYFIIAPDRHKSYYFQDRTSCLLSPNKKQISRFYSNYSCFRRLSINDVYSILHRPRAGQTTKQKHQWTTSNSFVTRLSSKLDSTRDYILGLRRSLISIKGKDWMQLGPLSWFDLHEP